MSVGRWTTKGSGADDQEQPPPGARPRPRRSIALFPTLRGYRRPWLTRDLLAAAALLVITIPEQLATARLAGMPPITGFFAFLAGTIAFAAFGSNRQMSVGADSTIAPLFAVGIAGLAVMGSANYIDLVGVTAVLVGAIVLLVGVLRLGWIAELLSAPIITGFMAGVAVIIVVNQLPDIFGLGTGSGSTAHRLAFVVAHLAQTNPWTLAIAGGVFAILVGGRALSRRFPGALVGLIASTIFVAALGRGRTVSPFLGICKPASRVSGCSTCP